MQKLTLGSRLGLAFGALIVLMCGLGGLAVWRISLAVRLAANVATKHAPEVRVANHVDISAWRVLHDIPNYALTGREEFLRKGRQALVTLKDDLKAANDLSAKFPDLVDLDKGETEAQAKTTEFEARVDGVEAEYKNLAVQEVGLDAAAKTFMDECRNLLHSYYQKMDSEIEQKLDGAVLKESRLKIAAMTELIDLGNAIRVDNFKAQAAGDTEALRNALKGFAPLDRCLAVLEPTVKEEQHQVMLRKVREAADNYRSGMERILKSQLAIAEQTNALWVAGDAVTAKATAVADGGMRAIEQAANEVAAGLALTSTILIVGLLLATLAGVLVAWLSARAITGPIREGVNALASTASQISSTISQLASNASEAAAAVAETTTTVEEVRQTAQVAADKAKAVADNAQGAARAAQAGRQATDQTAEGLSRIRDQMSSIGESVTRLSEQSQAVGDIVSTVTDLAEQSNLLAVNASIEAAKAGDAGRGFAVVAQEIRSLAEQSKESTKQVRAILSEVQRATGKAVMEAEQGGKSVAAGSQQAQEAGQAIKTLADTVQDATRAAVQIAASSQQQLVGMEQVGRAMENIRQATTQNAEGARQLSAAAHSLQEVGMRLKAMVDSGNERKAENLKTAV
jgi:methyl-accepting chemotaxis protein